MVRHFLFPFGIEGRGAYVLVGYGCRVPRQASRIDPNRPSGGNAAALLDHQVVPRKVGGDSRLS